MQERPGDRRGSGCGRAFCRGAWDGKSLTPAEDSPHAAAIPVAGRGGPSVACRSRGGDCAREGGARRAAVRRRRRGTRSCKAAARGRGACSARSREERRQHRGDRGAAPLRRRRPPTTSATVSAASSAGTLASLRPRWTNPGRPPSSRTCAPPRKIAAAPGSPPPIASRSHHRCLHLQNHF